jgi:cell division cycle 14
MASAVEIIPNKLYWISDKTPPKNQPNSYYFCVDNELVYQPFCSDFGPLNLAMTYKFCVELERLLKNPIYSSHKIYHYTSLSPSKRSNAACLMGAFQILILQKSSLEAWRSFEKLPSFADYRDAGYGGCTYKCTIHHVLKGLEFSKSLGWFNLRSFNLKEYEFYEKVENGDWNWVIPGKMLAFACPNSSSVDSEGFKVWTPEDYSRLFHEIGVTAVVRLNNATYDAERFRRLGIRHYDLYFVDGSVPSEDIVHQFLQISEREAGVAVHCKAGLGRTGTLIGCYAMKHFNFPAAEFIGYIRLCRPGSVLGPQQQFLLEMETKCRMWGEEFREKGKDKVNMSPEEKFISVHGDAGQAERLVNAKKLYQSSPASPFLPTGRTSSNGPSKGILN